MRDNLDRADRLLLGMAATLAFASLAGTLFLWPLVGMYIADGGAAGSLERYLALSLVLLCIASEVVALAFVSRRRPLGALLFAVGPLLFTTVVGAVGALLGYR